MLGWKKNEADLTDVDRQSVRKLEKKGVLYIVVVAVVTLAVAMYSITFNSSGVTIGEVYGTLVNQLFPGTFDIPEKTQFIVMKVYAPRVMMAIIVGAILALCGCITQTILKNPLATPYTLGVSASASFGAGLAIIAGFTTIAGSMGLVLNAFIFSLIPATVILLIAARKNIMTTTMILIGISISYMFSAANTLMQYFGNADAVKTAMFWSVGDLNAAMLSQIPYVLVTLIATAILALFLLKDIDIMRMGDDTAASLGVNVRFVRTGSIILACFATAAAVSFVGAIGFICLLGPQISRMIIGGNLKYLLPASAVTGALLLTLADLAAKSVVAPVILPVGAITALVGSPVLIYLLVKNKNMVVG